MYKTNNAHSTHTHWCLATDGSFSCLLSGILKRYTTIDSKVLYSCCNSCMLLDVLWWWHTCVLLKYSFDAVESSVWPAKDFQVGKPRGHTRQSSQHVVESNRRRRRGVLCLFKNLYRFSPPPPPPPMRTGAVTTSYYTTSRYTCTLQKTINRRRGSYYSFFFVLSPFTCSIYLSSYRTKALAAAAARCGQKTIRRLRARRLSAGDIRFT